MAPRPVGTQVRFPTPKRHPTEYRNPDSVGLGFQLGIANHNLNSRGVSNRRLMSRHLSRSRRKEIDAKKRAAYVLEHQRDLSDEERKRYLLTVDPQTQRAQVRSLERTSSAYGLRAAFGKMMSRVFSYAPSPIPSCDIEHFRFHSGIDATDNYQEMLLRWHQVKLLGRLA